MEIKILGSGCSNCAKLEKVTKEGIAQLGIEAQVEKVEDMQKIMSYGVMSTPALVINGVVKLVGKVPNKAKIIEILEKELKA
ncbi:thioredoxin family protein [Desulfosporosinus fructosivorans]|uniref:Thioredoxin family protein n=1 Tax=Desulfosporosinus fructosivorans TaxID=2018669 RepID=A0A4Z0R4F2_9FIRM|nr:thioredoxin family protein [Desulfosporosinus fructosivorans]TGE37672.1 thioredoxin family protein [Desulfosporosinus fructosivorans]TGE37678.1 thioredoxin family protein [Desulfosporosinus fructosivorans]